MVMALWKRLEYSSLQTKTDKQRFLRIVFAAHGVTTRDPLPTLLAKTAAASTAWWEEIVVYEQIRPTWDFRWCIRCGRCRADPCVTWRVRISPRITRQARKILGPALLPKWVYPVLHVRCLTTAERAILGVVVGARGLSAPSG